MNQVTISQEVPRTPVVAYKVSETMHMLRISKATLYRMVARNQLKLVKFGSASRITAESIDKVLQG